MPRRAKTLAKSPRVFQQREGGTFFYKFSIAGVEYRKTTGSYDETEARAIAEHVWHAAHVEAAIVTRANPNSGPKDLSLDHAAEAFATSQVARFESSETETLRRLRVLVEGIGPDTMVTEITTKVIADYAARRRDTISAWTKRKLKPRTVNGELSILQWLLTYCAETEAIPNMPRIAWSDVRCIVPAKPIRRLSQDEQRVILASAPEDYRRVLEFALETGLRRGNLVALTWDGVDFGKREIVVVAKGGKILPIHMTDWLFKLLSDVPRVPGCDHVFTYVAQRNVPRDRWGHKRIKGQRYPIDYWSWGRWFAGHIKELIKDGKLTKPATIHDLRRTFGSETMCEVGLERASKLLGHSSTRVTEAAYAVFLPKEVREASELASLRREVSRLQSANAG